MSSPVVCVRLLDAQNKGYALSEAVNQLALGRSASAVFVVPSAEFKRVPGVPFAYWAGTRVRSLFSHLSTIQSGGRRVCFGLSTKDDSRFVRLCWEVASGSICTRWYPFVKGGAYATFYSDPHLVLDWEDDGERLKAFAEYRTQQMFGVGSWSRWINNWDSYFLPGINWSRRSQRGLSLRAFPAGCIFSDKAPVIFAEPASLPALLALTNSRVFKALVELQMAFGSYEVGVLQRTVLPHLDELATEQLGLLAGRACSSKRSLDTTELTSHAAVLPALLAIPGDDLSERTDGWAKRVATVERNVAQIQSEINALSLRLYGLSEADLERSEVGCAQSEVESDGGKPEFADEDAEHSASIDAPALVSVLVDYLVGSALGRWDIRYATGESAAPEQPDPFVPLPVCPPGMLQNAQGLPARPGDVPAAYPICIPWDGILAGDSNHPLDVERRIREMVEIIWNDGAEAIEHEACEILGVKSLRDYFGRPGAFFADHLKRYSKSRRQAPIYWPLSTASGSYTLWVYYHRLTEQTLYKCVNNFVDPKIQETTRRLATADKDLTTQKGVDAARTRDLVNDLRTFLSELQDFKTELLRVAALPYKPNLNDGVIINAAPLHNLFRHRKWAKDCENCWKSLEKGEYDWAHMALNVWPDRVRDVCRRDKSIAIAHDLENLYEGQPEQPKTKGRRKKKPEEQEVDI